MYTPSVISKTLINKPSNTYSNTATKVHENAGLKYITQYVIWMT
jgi:hypothetical protein